MRYKKFFILPKEVLEFKDNDYMLCIMAFLQTRKGLDEIALTNYKELLKKCGYSYGYNPHTKEHLNTIKATLNTLQSYGYIHCFYNYDGEVFEKIDGFTISDQIYIEVNPNIANYTAQGFISVNIDDYIKIFNHCLINTPSKFKKLFRLYCFISQRIMMPANRTRTIDDVKSNPLFYRTTIVNLQDRLGEGFNRTNIVEFLKTLNDMAIFHINSSEVIALNNGNLSHCGTVIVKDSEHWQIELDCATSKIKKNRREYGEVD